MRRTKQAAARTREAILDAALACFNRHGLSQATLDDIACAAKVTRGAVYWHFRGKQQLVRALRERLSLPLLDRADTELLHAPDRPPLARVEHFLLETFEDLRRQPARREALALMHFKCEYVGELQSELDGMLANCRVLMRAFESVYREARAAGGLRRGVDPKLAAQETLIFMAGLMRLWLLDRSPAGLRKATPALVRAHLRARQPD
jgi:TetR/AcrR family acrAB operon transcriptional repressor